MGAAFAAAVPMLKNIQSPDAGEELVLLNSVTGEQAPLFAVEFISRGVPTLFNTPVEVKRLCAGISNEPIKEQVSVKGRFG